MHMRRLIAREFRDIYHVNAQAKRKSRPRSTHNEFMEPSPVAIYTHRREKRYTRYDLRENTEDSPEEPGAESSYILVITGSDFICHYWLLTFLGSTVTC